ncbi:MAG: hypothetical protein ACJ0BT_01350 [Pseudohongiellaceae bacterium]
MGSDRANNNEESFVSMRKKKGMKGLEGLLLLIVIAVSGGYYWLNNDEDFVESQPLLMAVQIGDIENTVAATGSLKPFETVEVADYQTVLTAQNTLFYQRTTVLNNKIQQLNSMVSFYQALGGGWDADDEVTMSIASEEA